MKEEQSQDLRANCNRCTFKKEDTCPYIEEIVDCHLFSASKSREVFHVFKKEKRKHPRTKTSIPAFISSNRPGEENVHIGSILDISLGGLLISIPRRIAHDVLTGPQAPEFEIITESPDRNKPTHLNCRLVREVHYQDHVHVGASIIH